jgi:protein-S-isoprenylcysteine O-methyltransferase Ste14
VLCAAGALAPLSVLDGITMNERMFFNILLLSLCILAVITAMVLLFVAAPYGRHSRKGWGPAVANRLGWIVMEAPAPLVFAACFVLGVYRDTWVAWLFLLLWQAHYAHRSFIYPFELRTVGRRMPVLVMSLGFLFNLLNGYLNGRYLYTFSGGYPATWLADPRFVAGVSLFVAGYAINRQADRTLRGLRANGESGYAVPYGGLYRWISCPNYFGEIVVWVGWAIATWSPAGLAFALWTAANLAPRAQSHHRWYHQNFADYPMERKALLPGLW